jgi:hypothetical protein
VSAVQAAYYIPAAAAPFISRRAFEKVTGPKTDWWLVITVGTLVGVVGGVLATAAARGTASTEIRLLGAGTAAGLAAVDVVYVARRRISPIYLVDGAIEAGLVAGWLIAHAGEADDARTE